MSTTTSVPSDTYTEKLNQWGLLLSVCVYGAHVSLFCRCLWSFSQPGNRRYPLLIYTIILFAFATTAIALQIWWTQVAFIDNHTYTGGPQKFLLDHYSSGSNTALTLMYVLINWLADGLILYRFYVLCGCTVPRFKRVIFAIVATCLGTLIAVSMAFFKNITSLGINLWTNSPSITPGIAYMAVSLSVNTILTLLIIFRILLIRRNLRQALGPHSQTYTSIIALLVESAALYTIVGLMTVVTCGVGSPIQYALLPMLGQLQAIPPILITSRVAEGLALSRSKYSELQTSRRRSISYMASDLSSDVKFSPPSPSQPASRFSMCSSMLGSPIMPISPLKHALRVDTTYSSRHVSLDFKDTVTPIECPVGSACTDTTLIEQNSIVDKHSSYGYPSWYKEVDKHFPDFETDVSFAV